MQAWRSGELGTDENPLLVACWDGGQAPGDEFEGNVSRVAAEKNLSMRIVLGNVQRVAQANRYEPEEDHKSSFRLIDS